MKKLFLLPLFSAICILQSFAMNPLNELSINDQTFTILTDIANLSTSDEVVFAGYPTKRNKVCCMAVDNYYNLAEYKATTESNDGKTWTNVGAIEVMTVEKTNNLFAFKSAKGYLNNNKIGEFSNAISSTSLWNITLTNSECVLSCPTSKTTPVVFYNHPEMHVFSYIDYTDKAPYYIYYRPTKSKCSKPIFDLPEARYSHAINVTVTCSNANERISYSVYRNDNPEPFATGISKTNKCIINLPADKLINDTKYRIQAVSSAEGYANNESSATYYVCTRQYLAFTKVNDISEIYENDILIFACPELGSAMAIDEITDSYNNRYGVPVEIKNNRIDIIDPTTSKVAFFYVNASSKDSNAYTFNDYEYKTNGKTGFLAVSDSYPNILATISDSNATTYTADWLIKIINGTAHITPYTDYSFSKSIFAYVDGTNSIVFQSLSKGYYEQFLKPIEIYHPNTKISLVEYNEIAEQKPAAKPTLGGFITCCNRPMTVKVFSITGQLLKVQTCENGDFIDLPSGIYIVTVGNTPTKIVIM